MPRQTRLYLALATCIAATACVRDPGAGVSAAEAAPSAMPASAQQDSSAAAIDQLYAQSARLLFQARPVDATDYGLSQEEVGRYYADTLPDFSPQAEAQLRAGLLDISRQLAQAPAAGTESEAERLNREIMASVTRYFAGNPAFPVGYIDSWMGLSPFIVNQINGPLIDIPRSLEDNHAIATRRDADDYLARLKAYDGMVRSIEQRFLADAEQGWIAPRVLLEGALGYLSRFTAPEPAQHGLVTSFADKLAAADSIDQATVDTLVAEAAGHVAEVIYPALGQLAATVEKHLEEAPAEHGVWAQPKGGDYYRDAIRFLGDSDLSADEIHAVGLAEIERISGEMDRILRKEGYAQGSVGERMVALSGEPRFLYEDSKAGREALLADLNKEIEAITERMKPWFNTAPPYRVEVRAYPEEIQDSAAGGEYQSPSVDGSKPGIYWINLRDMKGVARFTLKTLTYHEANPGHHWQVALNLAQQDFPFLRRISPYNAYAEGWALYAELVAWELGMYEDDPFGNLGRLQDELFRAVRLVVDTGLHHKRWSRDKAIAFMMDVTGTPESTATAEIERYMAWPGQALGYKLGMLKIQALRAEARQALGEDFDIAAFHDLVLLGGAMPMSLLERRVQHWIEQQRQAS